jgi:hypothetical protein
MKYFLVVVVALALAGCGGEGSDALSGTIRAAKLGRVSGPGACGVENAYRVTQAGGVQLSNPATLSRKALRRLDNWLREDAIPVIGRKGGGLVEIRVASHYACRTRNSQSGARLSEHAKGNAIDISAFVLADGTTLAVLDDWDGPDARLMRRLHASACGPFGTVLGPNADRHHQDHFHLDVASYRSGSFCQ